MPQSQALSGDVFELFIIFLPIFKNKCKCCRWMFVVEHLVIRLYSIVNLYIALCKHLSLLDEGRINNFYFKVQVQVHLP